jgi:hypothetical protein
MLAGVDQDLVNQRPAVLSVVAAHGPQERCQLDELGAGPNDVQKPHPYSRSALERVPAIVTIPPTLASPVLLQEGLDFAGNILLLLQGECREHGKGEDDPAGPLAFRKAPFSVTQVAEAGL